jgi:hypothetical protein
LGSVGKLSIIQIKIELRLRSANLYQGLSVVEIPSPNHFKQLYLEDLEDVWQMVEAGARVDILSRVVCP